MPEDERIDAWLAGELSEEEGHAVEQSIRSGVAEERADDGDFLGLEAEPISEEVDALIGQVRQAGGHTPPDAEHWRDLLEPSDDPGLLGTLGGYEITSLIAVGGMSIVFKGRDPSLKRVVAIKTLTPELAANRVTHERFLREARSASRLEHDHIIPIYGVHDEGGVPFIAMKFVEGGTLQDVLDSGERVGIERQQSIARQIARALDFAHGHGIVHRDIKPANILLDAGGERAWLCDFGVARCTEDPSITYAGSVAGTPQYMAPEQASGAEYDHRCDLFSLGAVLYRCATGQPAFAGNTTHAVLKNLAEKEALPALSLNSKLPRWYDRLIAHLIEKDPDDRLPDAAAVLRCLDEESAPKLKRRRAPARWIALAAVFILGALGLGFYLNRDTAEPPVAFRIDGERGFHTSLAGAISAADDGDTIVLSGTALPVAVDGVVLPEGKSLTLRAAPGTPGPHFTTGEAGALGITSRSPLTLEGIYIYRQPISGGSAILRIEGSEARLVDCHIVGDRVPLESKFDVLSREIELVGDASVELERSTITTLHGQAITATDGAAKIRLIDSRVTCYHGVVVADGAVDLEAERARFFGQHFIVGTAGALPDLRCRVSGSTFHNARALAWVDGADAAAVRGRVRWEGEGNRFPLGKASLLVSGDSYHAGDYAEFEIGSATETAGLIENIDTGERFTSLQEAWKDPPAEGKLRLQLSGDIVCASNSVTPVDVELELSAAPGSEPAIIFTDNHYLSLQLRGPTSATGIAFVRRLATEGSGGQAIVNAAHAGPFHFEGCRFESSPNIWARSSGVGLAFSNVESATVRECSFHMPGAAALLVDHTVAGGVGIPSTRLELDRCLVAASLAVYHRSTVGKVRTEFTADRCVFVGDRLWQQSLLESPYPLHLKITDSLIDMSKTYFEIEVWRAPMAEAQKLRDSLSWDGGDNFHRPGTPMMMFTIYSRPVPESPKDLATLRFDTFLTEFKNASEPGAAIVDVIDRARLFHPISATGLRDLLPPDHESPARETLELLSPK